MRVLTNHEAISVSQAEGTKTVVARGREFGTEKTFSADSLLVAVGRRSNADLFKPEKTGVKTDEKGFVIVDDYFRTTKKRIWAFGDAIGKYMFRHVANEESGIVWYNWSRSLQGAGPEEFISMDYSAVPWAVFSYPPIATVGMNLRQAKESGRPLLVGQAGRIGPVRFARLPWWRGRPPGGEHFHLAFEAAKNDDKPPLKAVEE